MAVKKQRFWTVVKMLNPKAKMILNFYCRSILLLAYSNIFRKPYKGEKSNRSICVLLVQKILVSKGKS